MEFGWDAFQCTRVRLLALTDVEIGLVHLSRE